VIRLDRDQLQAVLNSDPTVAMEVYGTVETNPMGGANGTMVPGPAGYGVRFASVFSRKAAPPGGPESLQAITDLTDGTPVQKILAMQLLAKYVQLIATSKEPTDQAKQFEAVCYQAIFKARNDPSPAVSAWAKYVVGSMSDARGRSAVMDDMADDADWRHRLLALILANGVDLSVHKGIADRLSADPEPCVRAFANAAQDLVAVAAKLPPPTTAPAAAQEPATQP
jgi:hypothetical protein